MLNIKCYYKFCQIQADDTLKDKIPIFATQAYADFIKETKKYHTIWLESQEEDIHYLIPFSVMKKGFFKKGMFLTAVISLGSVNTIELEKEFLNLIVKYIKKHRLCDWIQQPSNWAIFNTHPDGAINAPFGTYKINLKQKSEEELFRNIYKRNRQYINKATREGVVIKKGFSYLDDALILIQNTLNKAKFNSFSIEKAQILKKILINKVQVYVAYYNGIPQAGTIFLANSFATYGFYAGTSDRPINGATPLLYWEAIKDFKKNGSTFLDFVGARINPEPGSKQEKLQFYKRHLGAELHEGFLWKMVINNPKYQIFKFYIKIMNLLKGRKSKGDIIDQEIARMNSN